MRGHQSFLLIAYEPFRRLDCISMHSSKRDKVTPGPGPASFRPKPFEIFSLYDLRVIARQGKHCCL